MRSSRTFSNNDRPGGPPGVESRQMDLTRPAELAIQTPDAVRPIQDP